MAFDIFDERLLIATVNDPSFDEGMSESFMLNDRFGDPEPTESDTVDILRRTGESGLAEFNAQGAEANVVGWEEADVIDTVKFPFIREKIPMTPGDLTKMKDKVSKIYRTQEESLEDVQDKIMNTYQTKLKRRARNAELWMIMEVLTKGIITYSGPRARWKIDFQIDQKFFPLLSGSSVWGGADEDIVGNLTDWTGEVNGAVEGAVNDVYVGKTAAKLLLNSNKVHGFLDTNNLGAGRLTLDPNTDVIGIFNNQRFIRWSKTAKRKINGVWVDVPFLPPNGLLMLSSNFKGRRLFGLNEEFVDGMRVGDPYFMKSWELPDPAVRWLLMASRPLPVPEQEGSWLYAEVAPDEG